MHGSNGLRCRSLLQEGIDRFLIKTGFKKVLELWKDLINIGCKLNFQPSPLLDGVQHTPGNFQRQVIEQGCRHSVPLIQDR